MTQKVLVMYGDGHGPAVIRAAEKVLRNVAPDIEVMHGEIGAGAYENTSYALPSRTMDLMTQCDAILSGPVDMRDIPERDPLATIKKQLGLYLDYSEFRQLCSYMGTGIDTVLLSPTIESTLNVYETQSLDGVASEYYTSVDNVSRIFSKSNTVAEMKRKSTMHLISNNVLYPLREKMIRNDFYRHFAATEFKTKDISTTELMYDLAHDPSSVDLMICDIHSATCVWGLCTGLVGGSGLMPRAYLGDKVGLFIPSETIGGEKAIGRELNPTSAILSTAVMLLNLGREAQYDAVVKGVREMYRMGRTTPDIGGKINADAFSKGVSEIAVSELQA